MTEQELVDAYCNGWKSVRATAKELGINRETYRSLLRKYGIDTTTRHWQSQYEANFQIFDQIDTEQKAYWLGFLYADGHLAQDNRLAITLAYKDEDHLISLRAFFQSNHKIRYFSSHNDYGAYPSCSLIITNWYLAKRLRELGITVKRPHFHKLLSQLPKKGQRHFIRGFFDGDGCATTKRSRLIFAGQKDILAWIRKVFSNNLGTRSKQRIQSHSVSKKTHYLEYGGRFQVKRIADWLYQDATIYLNRKRATIVKGTYSSRDKTAATRACIHQRSLRRLLKTASAYLREP